MVIEYLRNVTSPNWNTCYQIIVYFHAALYCCLPQLRFHWKDSLQYFLQNRSIVVMNSLSFYLSWKVLTSLFLRTVLPLTVFLVDSFFFFFSFSFSSLNILFHSFLDCRVSAVKSTSSLMEAPFVCDQSLYSCCFQDSFFVSDFMCTQSLSHSSPTLCDLIAWSPPGSSIHGIFQARVL